MAVNTDAQGFQPAEEPAVRYDRPSRGNPVFQFVRDCRNELRKVVWPTRQETTRLTLVVIGVSAGTGLVLGGFDYLIAEAFRLIVH